MGVGVGGGGGGLDARCIVPRVRIVKISGASQLASLPVHPLDGNQTTGHRATRHRTIRHPDI